MFKISGGEMRPLLAMLLAVSLSGSIVYAEEEKAEAA